MMASSEDSTTAASRSVAESAVAEGSLGVPTVGVVQLNPAVGDGSSTVGGRRDVPAVRLLLFRGARRIGLLQLGLQALAIGAAGARNQAAQLGAFLAAVTPPVNGVVT